LGLINNIPSFATQTNMLMKRIFFNSACLLIIALSLSGCETGRRFASNYSRQPKFISGIYLHGHTKSGAAANAVDMSTPANTTEPAAETEENVGAAIVQNDMIEYTEVQGAPGEHVHFLILKRKKGEGQDDGTDEVPTSGSESEPTGLKYADMVGIAEAGSKVNSDLYKFISKWYGTHYRLGGEDENGIDCSAFSRRLYGDVYGIDLTRTANEQYKICKKVKQSKLAEEGDLVFFRHKTKRVSHVGVYLANDYFVHSSTSQGVVISNLKDSYWRQHYITIGKVSRAGDVSGL